MNRILPLLHPVPIVIIGVNCGSDQPKANFTTIGDIAIAGINPPLLMLSLHQNHLSREMIDKTGWLSVNLPEQKWLAEVDYCGMVSGRTADKARLFAYTWHRDLPVIESMPVALLCQVARRVEVEQRVIYVVQVLQQIIRQDVDLANLSGLQTILYGLDNRYYSIGSSIGQGYREGNQYKN